jgi:hypothetical protein
MQLKKTVILSIILCSITWNGCENFLRETPQGMVELETIDESILESLIIGMYEPLTRSRGRLWESHWGRALLLLEEHAVSRLRDMNDIANYRFNSVPLLISSGWPTIYESIARANLILDKLDKNTDIEQEIVNIAIGEACFIRALCYFQLVRIYGQVPLRLETVTDLDDSSLPLSEKSEIYEQILSDLLIAEVLLENRTNNPGRATAGAAKTMLADVYLTLGQYEDARLKAMEIINNKNIFGYDLITSLELLYSPTSPTNTEDIFSLKFSRVIGQGSFLAVYAAPLSMPEVAAVRAFENFGANTTAPLLRDWDNNDLRKNLNIYNTANVNGDIVEIEMAGNYTHLYGKHRDSKQPEETASGVDYYLYRYADVLLIYAETENAINGPTSQAYEAVNKIRRRAYGLKIDLPDSTIDLQANLTRQEFDSLIFRERGYEFMFEGKRWFDLKRTGRWKTVIPEAGKALPASLEWPFPAGEILYNEEID